ncbi:unnamed protein product [Closterium sp. NIES-54]
MLLAPEGDPDALDIPTPRSYAEAIEGPYSSQWQAAMDADMASWKSTGTYVDEVPPPGANIVSGMWIFRVKRPPGSSPAFKARYVARGFSQRQGVDFFHTFSPTPKMTTLRVLLHVAAQRDYELHSLDFSTAFLQGSLHEEIWLRRLPGFTGSFPAGTQWSIRRPVYGLRQAPRQGDNYATTSDIASLRTDMEQTQATLRRLEAFLTSQPEFATAAAATTATAAPTTPAAVATPTFHGPMAPLSPNLEAARPRLPEPFDPSAKGSDVRRFVATLEIYFEAIGCSTPQHDAARIRLAATLLRGPALEWIYYTDVAHGEKTWQQFRADLIERFEPINTTYMARQQIHRHKQYSSVAQYTQQMELLFNRITDLTEGEKIQAYTEGLKMEIRRQTIWGAEPGGAETGGAEPGGAATGGAKPGGAEPGGAGSARVASRGALSRREVLSPQELREWFARRWSRAAGAGGATATTSPGGAGAAGPGGPAEAAGVGPTGSSAGASGGTGAAGSAGPGAAGATGVGAAGGVGVGGSADAATSEGTGAGGATGAGAPAGSPGAVPTGPGGALRPRPYFVPLLEQVLGLPLSLGPAPPLECPQPVPSQSLLQPVSPLPAPSPYTGPTGGLAEHRAPASRPASPARPACTSRRTSRPRPPAVPGTHQMTLRPSTAPLRVSLPSPPESSLPVPADPESDSLRAASPTVARFLATYPELVGCLMYLMTCTRPDLAYPLSLLARYVAPGRHRKVHWDAAKRVLRYLCSTSGMGLVLGGRARVVLTGHADASWVDDLATHRSSQGYTFSLGSGSVSWRSTRSSSVLSSSCEAEIYAGAMAAQELRWLTYLLTDLGEVPRSPPVLYVDNKAMLALC